ncbi:MAG: hypothetical protein WC719_00320 [Patescibacteria group bacterium]|jgi:hypothetical protein
MVYSNLYARFYSFCQEIRTAGAALWRFAPSRFYLGLAALFQVVLWLQAVFIYKHLSGELLVLHYNIDFGIDLVGAPWHIFFYPLYALGILALNWIMVAALHRRQYFRLFANILLAAAELFSLFISLALMFIYLINFR